MNDLLILAVALIIGMLLGLFYFGGLWMTIHKIPSSRSPMLLTIGSFLLRAGIVIGVFYLVAQGQWLRVIICLIGFLVMRTILMFKMIPMTR